MEEKILCKKCGFHISLNDTICPFCNDIIENQEQIKESYIITPKLNDLFKEEKIDIKFNTRSIVNDVDASLDPEYEQMTLIAASKQNQYLQSDVTPTNLTRIDENLAYYREELEKYKKHQKTKLESFGIGRLQKIVSDFNDVVNMCNKYNKMIDNKAIKLRIKNTIEAYNKEIHYVKKYFILPLYDTEDLMNGSRLAKTCINLISLFLGYFVVSQIPFLDPVIKFIMDFMTHPTSGPVQLSLDNITSLIAICFAIWLTNIAFTFYIGITIKNRNFQVDKDKSYEIILTFTIIGWFVSTYHYYLALFYNIVLMLYIGYFGWINIKTKKKGLNWKIVKIFSICLTIILLVNLLLFMI